MLERYQAAVAASKQMRGEAAIAQTFDRSMNAEGRFRRADRNAQPLMARPVDAKVQHVPAAIE